MLSSPLAFEPPAWGRLVRGLLAAIIKGALRSPNLRSLLSHSEAELTDSVSFRRDLPNPQTPHQHITIMLQQLLALFHVSNRDDPTDYSTLIDESLRTHATSAKGFFRTLLILTSLHFPMTRQHVNFVRRSKSKFLPHAPSSRQISGMPWNNRYVTRFPWKSRNGASNTAPSVMLALKLKSTRSRCRLSLTRTRTVRLGRRNTRTVQRGGPPSPTRSSSRASSHSTAQPYPSRSASCAPRGPEKRRHAGSSGVTSQSEELAMELVMCTARLKAVSRLFLSRKKPGRHRP
ncbi:hypothetical protein B0F90DRAFT_193145 [Multifurca ochricompacta]|uniref:Uncharacterized protein n=1 Tax=Multifurca ochricompacta TaxID=376703 RepID=A0AAD4LW83_9AGAM|nr:hypothetical protein B0F90DRAFT_193145 [Multifurca ochricompacta]